MLLLEIFIILCGFELLLWTPDVWTRRKIYSAIIMVLKSALLVGMLVGALKLWTVLVTVIGLYGLINLLRVNRCRTHADYLYHSSRKTAVWLIGFQSVVLFVAWACNAVGVTSLVMFYMLAVGQLVCGIVLLASTLRHLRTTTPPKIEAGLGDKDLPSLTVAIPARNETEDLEACLRSLLASTYPKLEILVLDDCSQNKHTPEIIRGFAHDGVRFIAGKAPPDKWLAKNYAYHQLAEAASGELLLFCGVDMRFEPDSLKLLVQTLLQKQKTMISIIPSNLSPSSWRPAQLLTQPNRYAWELALPRRLLRRPPVLSSCWLITRQAFSSTGGFAAVCRQAVAESYFAYQTASRDDGYSFMQSSQAMGISSHKSASDQLATAIRNRYPQLHRRPEMIALVCATEFAALVWPLILLVVALVSAIWPLALLSLAAYGLQALTYQKIVSLTYRRTLIRGLWALAPAVLYDIWLLNYSMWLYEFSEVLWKGRNVCVPVMRVLPKLPEA